jgi:hypothetical protein
VIKLLEKTVSKSGTGFETRNTTAGREIIAEQGGVGRSEFYKAADPRRYFYRFRS